MKQITLLEVVSIGFHCGLTKISESISNILSHYDLFFNIEKLTEQENILYEEIEQYAKQFKKTYDEFIEMDIIEFIERRKQCPKS